MLNIKELEESLDKAISNETEESLLQWIESVKRREMLINFKRYILNKISYNGFHQLLDTLIKSEEQVFRVNIIKGLENCSLEPTGCIVKTSQENKPPDEFIKSSSKKFKAPTNTGLFLFNIAS